MVDAYVRFLLVGLGVRLFQTVHYEIQSVTTDLFMNIGPKQNYNTPRFGLLIGVTVRNVCQECEHNVVVFFVTVSMNTVFTSFTLLIRFWSCLLLKFVLSSSPFYQVLVFKIAAYLCYLAIWNKR